MLKLLPAFAVIAGLAFALPQTSAYSAPVSKKTTKKASATQADPAYEDKEQPNVTGMASSLYNCELGNKLTIFKKAGDDSMIALHWHNRLHRMMRISTSTGANRYENEKNGLVWIGIPSKGMLLDSKRGHQLANECKSKNRLDVTQTPTGGKNSS